MSLSDLIAILSFLGAVLAAVYARRASLEAKRANDLAAHSNKIEIYKAFRALHFSVLEKGTGIEHADVGRFYHPSQEAEFYFSSPETAEKVMAYFKLCFQLAETKRKLSRTHLTQEQIEELWLEQDKIFEEEARLSSDVERLLKSEIHGAVKRSGKQGQVYH